MKPIPPPPFTFSREGNAALFASAENRLRIVFLTPAIVRVTWIQGRDFSKKSSRIVLAPQQYIRFDMTDQQDTFTIATAALKLVLNKASGTLSYYDAAGKLLTREPDHGGRWLTPKDIYRNVFVKGSAIAYEQNVDGARATVADFETVLDRQAFEAKLEFVFSPDEALFGLGSHEEGYGNLRGKSRELYQQNMKAVVPVLVSSRGYGILFDCGSLMTFHDDALGSYWWADVVEELDFYLFQGDSFDDVTRACHHLTGPVPMLPKWAFGFVQSKERYVTADEMLEVVREHRRRNIPLDCIVLDWKSWPNDGGWGQKSFDPIRFPNPQAFTAELHALGARLMVSIWPIMTGGCDNQREQLEQNLMLGNQSTYDAFNPAARDLYWQQAQRGLWSQGIDAWWCDCTEPFEADWSGAVKPEPHARLAINTNQSKRFLDPGEINTYSLLHSQGIYEGQRKDTSAKRVVNLTRSSYAGQHRSSTITWNGDLSATWETLRRCIPEGLNFCATGEPWWTIDAGGFFVDHNPALWFWRGDYPDGCRGLTAMDALAPDPSDLGCRDLGFFELYTRWLQYAAYLPMFRSHGTDAAREAWRFGESGDRFYDAIVHTIRWRYRLLPHLYSLAAAVTRSSQSMMRAVALEFPQDTNTHDLTDQFLVGHDLLVCPVTQPMFFQAGSKPINEPQSRAVYLPQSGGWFNFWNSNFFTGGQTILAEAPLDHIPVFARAGSIIVLADVMQYADEIPDAPYEVRVYTGADADYVLYGDSGDSYDYEQGAFSETKFTWTEARAELTIHAREGSFPGMVSMRDLNLIFISAQGTQTHTVHYDGTRTMIQSTLHQDDIK